MNYVYKAIFVTEVQGLAEAAPETSLNVFVIAMMKLSPDLSYELEKSGSLAIPTPLGNFTF
ncbi:MAG: hypothetical protein DSM106950_27905 [Stigonema ocellatum SAG 48.90 = DSM 106950]|jgi:hypothetical protein|nr:hypothetical protein [Stigonema ocellatum SAG 48.90 = DSM 106950]